MGQMSKVGRVATKVFTRYDTTIIRYHRTNVVTFNKRTIILNSGGWRTATTKNRMNQATNQFGLDFRVWQEKGAWYVELPRKEIVDFKDGMMIRRTGK